MEEIGLESSLLKAVLSGGKTVEARLGRPRFLKFKEGDIISIREDIWIDNIITESRSGAAKIKIDQILYFETFKEMLDAIDYTTLIPSATSPEIVLDAYRQFYSIDDESEYGVVAMIFHLL